MKTVLKQIEKLITSNQYASPIEFYHILVLRYHKLGEYTLDRYVGLGYRRKDTWENIVSHLEEELKQLKKKK